MGCCFALWTRALPPGVASYTHRPHMAEVPRLFGVSEATPSGLTLKSRQNFPRQESNFRFAFCDCFPLLRTEAVWPPSCSHPIYLFCCTSEARLLVLNFINLPKRSCAKQARTFRPLSLFTVLVIHCFEFLRGNEAETKLQGNLGGYPKARVCKFEGEEALRSWLV